MHPEPTNHDLDLMRWLDGQMSPQEAALFETKLAAEPSLQAEATGMKQISLGLREHFPVPELKNADFFNHQIQQAIAADSQKQLPHEQSRTSLWQWLRSPWALGAAAAMVAVAAALMPETRVSEVVGSYAPNPGIQVHSYYEEKAGATVLMLEGLAEIPADRSLVGYTIGHSSTDSELAQTTLYDSAGQVVAVVAQNSRSEPVIISR